MPVHTQEVDIETLEAKKVGKKVLADHRCTMVAEGLMLSIRDGLDAIHGSMYDLAGIKLRKEQGRNLVADLGAMNKKVWKTVDDLS